MNKIPDAFPEELRNFVREVKWTFAKTMSEWPHEYVVRERVDPNLFQQLAQHVRANGHEEAFYQETFIYFEEDGMLYWTMDALVSETTIINRCRKETSYKCRLKKGTLP